MNEKVSLKKAKERIFISHVNKVECRLDNVKFLAKKKKFGQAQFALGDCYPFHLEVYSYEIPEGSLFDRAMKCERIYRKLRDFLRCKEDQPSFIPRRLNLEDLNASDHIKIGLPRLVVAKNESELPICAGLRIERDKELAGANAFISGEKIFTGVTGDIEDSYGHPYSYIQMEAYSFSVQFYKINLLRTYPR